MSRDRILLRSAISSLMAIVCLIVFASEASFARELEKPGEGILLAAFGSSIPEARSAYGKIEAAYRKAFPGSPVEWAYTSGIIRKKLQKEGIDAKSVSEALDALAKQGVAVVRAQSLHILGGAEYVKFVQELATWQAKNPDRLKAILLAGPLLESRADGQMVAKAVAGALPRGNDEALVLMGHGNSKGRAGLAFEGMRAMFRENGVRVFLASVEGEQSFEELLAELSKAGVKRLWLAPFMLVAGDHARNDMAGEEEDSWASRLKSKGYDISVRLAGLGELRDIQQIFIEHTRKAGDEMAIVKP